MANNVSDYIFVTYSDFMCLMSVRDNALSLSIRMNKIFQTNIWKQSREIDEDTKEWSSQIQFWLKITEMDNLLVYIFWPMKN